MSTEEHKRQEGARTKAATSGTVKKDGKIGGEWKFQKGPQFLKDRLAIWDDLYAKQKEVYAGKCALLIMINKTRQSVYTHHFCLFSFPKTRYQNYHA